MRIASRAGLALALLAALAPLSAGSQSDGDALIGLWSGERVFGPALRGTLAVRRHAGRWEARIADATASAAVSGTSVRFAFARHGARFRGTLAPDGRGIDGMWIQPPGQVFDQAYASRVTLRSVAANLWRGTVRPLDDRFTLYLKIFRDTDGTLSAVFRNPERNDIGGASRFAVSRNGDTVTFIAGAPPRTISAALTNPPDRLQATWQDPALPIALTRRTNAEAAAFFARPPGAGAYAYRSPPATGDGWMTASARAAGFDEATLASLVQRLIDVDPAARRPALVHSLLIARRGKLVLEEYFHGFAGDEPHDLRSAGKTFASVMLGAAMLHDRSLGPQTPVYEALARMGPFAHPDPRKAQITLAHLLTHTAGLACDDNDDASPGNEETMQSQRAQPDWWKYTLDLPMAHDPGTRYAYCSANVNLIGAVLKTRTATSLPELFERTVARPLQFGPYFWNMMPTGEGYLGGGAFVRPRDLLKVGQTFLDGGLWHGRRIVGTDWVRESTAPHAVISPSTTGLAPADFGNFYGEAEDGYGWHLHRVRVGSRDYREYEASGNGGQLLMVVPELELAVVVTAGNYRQGGIWTRFRDDLVGAGIIPAIVP